MNYLFFILLGIGILFSLIRFFKGPTSFDRIAALDTTNIIITGLLVLLAVWFNNGMFLDLSLAFGVLSFVETVVLSRYQEVKK